MCGSVSITRLGKGPVVSIIHLTLSSYKRKKKKKEKEKLRVHEGGRLSGGGSGGIYSGGSSGRMEKR